MVNRGALVIQISRLTRSLVNNNPVNELIYDFYGFPKHYYSERFRSGSGHEHRWAVKQALKGAGIDFKEEDRGLDHGAWSRLKRRFVCACVSEADECEVPLKVALGDETDVPILQVSLPGDGDPSSVAKLGEALSVLR